MSSVNKVILLGNLGANPEVRTTQNGKNIVTFSLATSEKVKGEVRTEWHKIVVLNDHLADLASKFLTKGCRVWVEGALKTDKYTDKNGVQRYQTQVVISSFRGELKILDYKEDAEGSAASPTAAKEDYVDSYLDDEVPF